jgi:hypothetical protein
MRRFHPLFFEDLETACISLLFETREELDRRHVIDIGAWRLPPGIIF